MNEQRFSIAPARTDDEVAAVADLFRAYAASLDVSPCFQGFETELATMPGKYAPPTGELLLARDAEGRPIGCIALRSLDPEGACEMKRLYVMPEGRGLGIGERLVSMIVDEAKRIGYREMRLDTLPSMTNAIALYRKFGFEPMDAYYETPLGDTVFLRRNLA
jgi:ribosomal protein S18 acetylase RimI-like enzyme